MRNPNAKNSKKTAVAVDPRFIELNPHFYNGNVKVGDMYTYNKLAGRIKFYGCSGSCGKHCNGCFLEDDWKHSPCYVIKSYVQYGEKLIKSHINNTVAMRDYLELTFDKLDKTLSCARNTKPVRIHSSGELESAAELKGWFGLAKKHPERLFYVYTKAYEILDEVFSSVKEEELPTNFYVNISIWHEFGIPTYEKWKHLSMVRAFVYDDGYDYQGRLKMNCYCPAYKKDEKGKVKLSHDLTCDACKICMQDKAKVCGCLSH